MPITLAPAGYTVPFEFAALVYAKEAWDDDWEWRPSIRFTGASFASAAHGETRCDLRYAYGDVDDFGDAAFALRNPLDLAGWWVRVDLVGPDGPVPEFLGKVMDEPRVLEGQDAGGPSGEQSWTAFGPQAILDRISLHKSFWDESEVGGAGEVDGAIEIGWLPGMNDLDPAGLLVGNRSTSDVDGVYLYGNTEEWTHKEYVEYLLKRFVDESDDDGPEWTLGGQTELLDDLTSVLRFEPVENIGAVIRRLIDPRYGVDYCIRPVLDDDDELTGFELEVFALLGEDVSFNGETLARNDNVVGYRASASHWQKRTEVERREDQRYNTVRIVGKRTVVCCSIAGYQVSVGMPVPSLVSGWNGTRQTEYNAGTGPSVGDPAAHDRVRMDERFRRVYQAWRAPDDWDQALHGTSVGFSEHGTYDWGVAPTGTYQDSVRATLPWTPLREETDYSVDPAVPTPSPSVDFLPPCVYLVDSLNVDPFGAAHSWSRADKEGIGVAPLDHEWGVLLSSTPNHLVYVGAGLVGPTETSPIYDPTWMVVTFAFEADHPPVAEMILDEDVGPSGGVLEIHDAGIECHVLAPYTVVGVSNTGQLIDSGSSARLLRDDSDRTAKVMAGAISRAQRDRSRAVITAVGLLPWAWLVGCVLDSIEDAGTIHNVRSPLTSVEWNVGERGETTTVIRTGFAESAYTE